MGGSWYGRISYARRRIDAIEAVVGAEAVERAISKAYEEYGARNPGEAWRIFLSGTREEVSAFHREVEAALERRFREEEDALYVDLVKLLAGNAAEGTAGALYVRAARAAVAADPTLLLPQNKERFLKAILTCPVSSDQ